MAEAPTQEFSGETTKLAEQLKFTVGDFWPFFIPTVVPTGVDKFEELSEDYALCLRAKAAGFSVYADLFPVLAHVGEVVFRMEDAKRDPRLPSKLTVYEFPNTTHTVLESLADDAAEFTGVPKDAVMSTAPLARKELASMWNTRPEGQTDLDFYLEDRVGRSYIIDLMLCHMKGVGDVFVKAFDGIKQERVLDYGSGIGTAALILAGENTAYCFEPNDVLWSFTEYRAKKLKRRVKRIEQPPNEDSYDTIVCWNVLEHLENPWVAIHDIAHALRVGGKLFHESDFTANDEHPMHHTDFDVEAAWTSVGLEAQGDEWYTKVKVPVGV